MLDSHFQLLESCLIYFNNCSGLFQNSVSLFIFSYSKIIYFLSKGEEFEMFNFNNTVFMMQLSLIIFYIHLTDFIKPHLKMLLTNSIRQTDHFMLIGMCINL